MNNDRLFDGLDRKVHSAVKHFWQTRRAQGTNQRSKGRSDQGARGAVTGGKQMDGFCRLLLSLLKSVGLPEDCVFFGKRLELPGYFRAEKKWDLLAVKDGQLLVALEAKSQVGPSFGNNFNNRTEEAVGSAADLWRAYKDKEGALNDTAQPWLGYVILLEDCEKTRRTVSVRQPHFSVLPDFADASYRKRCELLCRKLTRERYYNSTAFLCSPRDAGLEGDYSEPADDLKFETFARSLAGHVSAFVD